MRETEKHSFGFELTIVAYCLVITFGLTHLNEPYCYLANNSKFIWGCFGHAFHKLLLLCSTRPLRSCSIVCHVFSLKPWKSYPTGHKEKSGSKPYMILVYHIYIYILIYKYNRNDMSYSQNLGERRVVFETSLFFEIELGFGKR